MSMFREYHFMMNERNKEFNKKDEDLKEGEEWVWKTDYKTGKKKRIKKVKSI